MFADMSLTNMFADVLSTIRIRIKLLTFALEQKLKVHWNGIQKTFLLSYYTSKSEQAENTLVLPTMWKKLFLTDLEISNSHSGFY